MKAYFSATISDTKESRERYEKIIKTLKDLDVEVLQYGSHQISPHELLNQSDEDIKKVYKELDKFLKEADIYISEISEPSVGIGYEISQAITQRKPVLALNFEKSDFHPLATIQGLKSKYITYKKYNLNTLEDIIKEFIRDSKKKIDTKFILIISPEIDRYLEWAADYKRMHKAQVVRNAVEKEMESDKDYQKYLADKK